MHLILHDFGSAVQYDQPIPPNKDHFYVKEFPVSGFFLNKSGLYRSHVMLFVSFSGFSLYPRLPRAWSERAALLAGPSL